MTPLKRLAAVVVSISVVGGSIALGFACNGGATHNATEGDAEAKRLYCAKAAGAVEDLRAQPDPARIAGAAHLAVLAARFCSESEDVEDLSEPLLYGTPADLDRALVQLEAAFR